MIRTWVADVTALYREEVYEKYYKEMPEHRKRKADKMRFQKASAQSIGAWTLYEIAKRECKAAEDAVFNLSHSGDMVLCSIEDSGNLQSKVGCDIEQIKKMHGQIVERYFFESERNYILNQGTEEERAKAFYRYWVLKESFMKATRYGMKLGLDTFEIICKECGQPELVRKPDKIEGKYYFKEYTIEQPYKIAVCSTNSLFAEEIIKVDLSTYWR